MRALVVLSVVLVVACEARLSLGSACTRSGECVAPLVCNDGRCRAECVEHADCALGARCLLDAVGQGTCTLPDDPRCTDASDCAAGLVCVDRECANACASLAECPPDSRCEPGADGRARCVRNDEGADAAASDAPLTPDGGADCVGPDCIVQIVSGGAATCARSNEGRVWCWGVDLLGDGATHDTCTGGDCSRMPVPVHVPSGGTSTPITDAIAIAAGNSTACAIRADHVVYCWGDGWNGQLGASHDGRIARRVDGVGGVGVLDHVIALVAANEAWLAVRDVDPRVVGWGDSTDDIFLDGGTGAAVSPPIAVSAPPGELFAGGWHACVRASRVVSCWGRDLDGQAGGDTSTDVVHTPVPVTMLTSAGGLVLGARGACAQEGDEALCWGADFMLGGGIEEDPACDCRAYPRPVPRTSGMAFRRIFASASSDTAFALDATGQAWCWGYNEGTGLCVPGGGYSVRTPAALALPSGVEEIAPGYRHACARTRAGEVWCWGDNDAGQLGTGSVTLGEATPARLTFTP